MHECVWMIHLKFSLQYQSHCAPMTITEEKSFIPLTIPTMPTSVPGKGRGAQGEFCSAGDDGQPGLASKPRACGLQDLLCGPAAWRGGLAEGVSPLLLQVSFIRWCLKRTIEIVKMYHQG